MPLIDFDDIQAEENRRREVAVKAGASPRATKYEDSPLKQMVAEAVAESIPAVAEKFAEYKKNTPLPGYNFVSTASSFKAAEQVIEDSKKAAEDSQDEADEHKRLIQEAKENEMKITRTSTGQPKVEAGVEVTPLQAQEKDENKKGVQKIVESTAPKTSGTQNPSPLGSGDARATAAVTDNKGTDGKTTDSKK